MSNTNKELYELAWKAYERSKWLDQLIVGLKESIDPKSLYFKEGDLILINKAFIPTIIEALEKISCE